MKPVWYVLVLVTILFSCNGCSSENADNNDNNEIISEDTLKEINAFLASLSNFIQPDEQPTEAFVEEVSKEREGNTDECTVSKYKMAPGFSEMILLDPTSDVIYPGAMLKGESIPTGEYIGITGGRAPITLSVSLESLNGKPSVVIENPNISTVREGVKEMLQQGVTGSASAKVNFTTEEVYSEEHLNIALGASYTKGKNSVSGSFNFSSSEKKYKYVVKYLQVYYTIDLTIEDSRNPGKLFTEVPQLNSTSPVIVSSVKYGRMLLYTVETNENWSDTHAAFNAAFANGSAGGSGEHESFWNSSTVKALVIGGSSGDAAKVVTGPQGVYDYITEGGEYSIDSPGAPLGYTLRYIREGFPIANVVLASEYNIRTCYEAYQKFGIELYGFNPWNVVGENNLEIYGDMRIRVYQDGNKKEEIKWHHGANPSMNINERTFFEIQTPDSSSEVELYKPDLETDYIELYSSFYEANGAFSPLYFGNGTEKILLKNVQNTKEPYIRIILKNDTDEMRTYFYVWRIY